MSFQKKSFNSGKLVSDSPKTQYYLAIKIMVVKVLVGFCEKHLDDDLDALRNLKNRNSGVSIERH